MTTRFVTFLVAAAIVTPAAADIARPPPAPPVTPIFEIDKVDTRADIAQQTVKLYGTGVWRFEETTKGKSTASSAGNLTDDQLKQVRADLAAATWKTAPVMHCMMRTTSSTVFKANGKLVWTATACPSVKLDDASAKALDDLQQQLAPAWPAAASSGSGSAAP